MLLGIVTNRFHSPVIRKLVAIGLYCELRTSLELETLLTSGELMCAREGTRH